MSVALSSPLVLLIKEEVLPKLLGPSRVLQDLVALGLLLILLLVPLWVFLRRALLAPLRTLIEANERAVRGGDTGVLPAEVIPENDLGRVMESRNEMLRRLDEQSERLRQEARSLLVSWEAMREILGPLATFAGEEKILQRGLEALARVVGACYRAMHVLDERGNTINFLHTGLTADAERRLGGLAPPRGLGLLGALQEGRVLRLEDLTQDPRHRGFPPGHPPMQSFLGVPIASKANVYGRVYLTENAGGLFTEEDGRLALTVAQSVALAVESNRLARRIRAAERLSRRTLASLFDAVVVLGRQGRIRYANRVFSDWFGLEPSGVVGRPLRDVAELRKVRKFGPATTGQDVGLGRAPLRVTSAARRR